MSLSTFEVDSTSRDCVGDQPFWSVMIPTYNPDCGYLRKAIESVLMQDEGRDQMQIEVVDDCSPEVDVQSLVREIAGNRVNFYRAPENRGLGESWNTCVSRGKGNWIHILHQDDLVLSDFYRSLRSGITQHPEVGAAYTRHAYCDESGNWHRLSPLEAPKSGPLVGFLESLMHAERIQCASIVVRRDVYQILGGFDSRLTHALDWEMWIRIASSFEILYEPKILACWRNHSAATTSRQIRSGENLRDILKAIRIWQEHLKIADAAHLGGIAKRRFGEEGLFMARRLYGMGDYEAALNQILAARQFNESPGFQYRAAKLLLKTMFRKTLQ